MKILYTVISNMPGYMPTDDAPFQTTNRREAESVLAAEARQYREEYYVSGSSKNGYYWCTPRSREGADIVLSIGECPLLEVTRQRVGDNTVTGYRCNSCGVFTPSVDGVNGHNADCVTQR